MITVIMNLGKWISMIFEMNPGKRISMIFEMTLANEYPWSDLYFDIQISMSFLLFETKYLDIFDIKTYFTFRNCLMWYMTALWPCICMKQKPITRQVRILILNLLFMASTAITTFGREVAWFFIDEMKQFWCFFLEV